MSKPTARKPTDRELGGTRLRRLVTDAQRAARARNGLLGGRPSGVVGRPTRLRREARAKVLVQEAARADRTEALTVARLLEEWRRIALIDIRTFFDEHNNLKPINEFTAEQGAALSSFEVVIKNAAAGDGHTDTVHKFKLWDKIRVLESAAKYLGMLKPDELTVTVTLDARKARLSLAKQRLALGP